MKTLYLIIEYDNISPNYCKFGEIECKYFQYDVDYDYSMCDIGYIDKRILHHERLFITQSKIVPKPEVCKQKCVDNVYIVKIKKYLNY